MSSGDLSVPSEVIDTLSALVRINSVNSFYAGGNGEAAISTWIREFLDRRGIPVSAQPVYPARDNLLATLRGRDSTRRIVLEAHQDTVGVAHMSIPPFDARIDGGRLFGRGACDTKGGLAAMLHAIASVHEEGRTPPCEVILAAVVDEEARAGGIARLCTDLRADAAVVAEPTELRLVVACKGALRWRIVARGVAAHSSKPHLGVNAIESMARVILALERDGADMAGRRHPLLGPPTCSVGTIRGGTQVNVIPDECAIEVDRRLLPGEDPEAVLAHYADLLERLNEENPRLGAANEAPSLVDPAMETPAEAAPVRLAARLLADLNLDPAPCGVTFGCDASKLSRAGIPSIIFGPGSIDQAHSAAEFVELKQVGLAYRFYRDFLLNFGA